MSVVTVLLVGILVVAAFLVFVAGAGNDFTSRRK